MQIQEENEEGFLSVLEAIFKLLRIMQGKLFATHKRTESLTETVVDLTRRLAAVESLLKATQSYVAQEPADKAEKSEEDTLEMIGRLVGRKLGIVKVLPGDVKVDWHLGLLDLTQEQATIRGGRRLLQAGDLVAISRHVENTAEAGILVVVKITAGVMHAGSHRFMFDQRVRPGDSPLDIPPVPTETDNHASLRADAQERVADQIRRILGT